MVFPSGSVPVPDVVSRIAAGRPVRAVWQNELGGVTFRIECGGDTTEYVKTGPGEFTAEADRLAWAGRYTPVPPVLGCGTDWLHTAGLPGESAVHPHSVARPRQAAMVIGAGLRMLHDALPVDSCPWVRDDFGDAPPADRLVVCHGDACAPNTLIDASTAGEARCSGHVDLGALGVADRWADLAVAMLSLGWNYPSSRQRDLLAAYGVDGSSDLAAVRIDYYQRRWQAPDQVGG